MTRTASRRALARFAAGTRPHCSCASLAAATRNETSPGCVRCTAPTCSCVAGLIETSWSGAAVVAMRECYAHVVEVGELRRDPRREVVPAHERPRLLEAAAPLRRIHRQCLVEGLRLSVDVERVDGQRPLPELLVRARVLREDEHAVAAVH